jgi:hypothetical protein
MTLKELKADFEDNMAKFRSLAKETPDANWKRLLEVEIESFQKTIDLLDRMI